MKTTKKSHWIYISIIVILLASNGYFVYAAIQRTRWLTTQTFLYTRSTLIYISAARIYLQSAQASNWTSAEALRDAYHAIDLAILSANTLHLLASYAYVGSEEHAEIQQVAQLVDILFNFQALILNAIDAVNQGEQPNIAQLETIVSILDTADFPRPGEEDFVSGSQFWNELQAANKRFNDLARPQIPVYTPTPFSSDTIQQQLTPSILTPYPELP